MYVPDKYSIEVTINRNIEADPENEDEFEAEVERLLEEIGREWTVTDYEFYDYDSFRPGGDMAEQEKKPEKPTTNGSKPAEERPPALGGDKPIKN